ncbi:SHOCT domain-containing protein [Pseudogracilibacillus auburnensis]|uniref:Putative membrane protein n=1 Tax=Pseudogracilibacillus auburnensis TaxID=1494959 RepID=A0A2V3W8U2_9BACI|nr:SHOCT domain-containing protein [Pseudogracilibacillus auburnensis]PXW90460.1 putative membrane protein [Pseudogracilibacillus auburnensis]
MHMMHGYGSFLSMIMMIIFWVGLISFGIFLIKNFINGGNKKTSLQIIQERLAKGEIDETEYERIKSIIKQDRQ